MIRNDATAVDLLAELIDCLATSERAAAVRHIEILKRLDAVADIAACADQNAAEASSRAQRLLDGE